MIKSSEMQGARLRGGAGARCVWWMMLYRKSSDTNETPGRHLRSGVLPPHVDASSAARWDVESLEASLTGEGAAVILARTGERGLEELRARAEPGRPDAILLDLGLPGMSGTDVLVNLRTPGSPWIATPVIVCSDPKNVSEGERCIMLGIHDFVPKDSRFIETLSASLRTIWVS